MNYCISPTAGEKSPSKILVDMKQENMLVNSRQRNREGLHSSQFNDTQTQIMSKVNTAQMQRKNSKKEEQD